MKKIIKRIINGLSNHGLLNLMPDKIFLKLMFWVKLDQRLNLSEPETFNEKLQWLKLFDRKPEYSQMVDKYEAKKYVASIIGEEYIIPTLGIWEHFDDIDFAQLPDQFVLKCTHDSGGLVICKDKASFDMKAAKKKINASLKTNFYYHGREWPYKNVKPRIIAEQYMTCENGDLPDYKFYCFNGNPEYIGVFRKRFSEDGLEAHFLDMDWNAFDSDAFGYSPTDYAVPKPECFEEMVRLATELSADIPHVRVDLYGINEKVYFGEMTFFPLSGYWSMNDEWGKKIGSWIKLMEN